MEPTLFFPYPVSITPLSKHNRNTSFRQYQAAPGNLGRVSIDEHRFLVDDHRFWHKFASGWELDTEHIYRSRVKPGAVVLDVGAWIGPTILFALSCGASKVIALEPNPESFVFLQRLVELNPDYADRIVLIPRALSPTAGSISMGFAEGESDTSMFTVTGSDIEVQSITFDQLVEESKQARFDFIKIDIEGSEVLLSDVLRKTSQNPGQPIHLSVHVAFFPPNADIEGFADALSGYTVYTDRGEYLSQTEVTNRLLSNEDFPDWGNNYGNIFELLLVAKGSNG